MTPGSAMPPPHTANHAANDAAAHTRAAHIRAVHTRVVHTLALMLISGLALTAACDAGPPERPSAPAGPMITSKGVGCARIGDRVAQLREACDIVADTVLLLEGMEQPALIMGMGEADVLAEIVDGHVWRLSVLGAGPLTPDSLGVGTPFVTVADRLDVDVHAGEGRYFAVPREPCGISFELEGVSFEGEAPTAEGLLESGGAARIARVLILGC